jgi:uncharacterized protein involved in exopolysaccharide biosynthesis
MEIRRATILGFTIFMAGLVLCGVGVWLLLSPAQYQATARIQINPDVTDTNQNGQGMPSDPYFIQTEFEILQSQAVLGKVINSLSLNVEWGRKYAGGGTLTTNETIAILKKHLDIAPVRNTKLIEISFASEDPSEAAKVANAIAKAYQDYRLEMRRQLTLKGIEVLQQEYQEEELKVQIQQTNVDLLREKFKIQDNASPSPNQSETFLTNLLSIDGGTNALAQQPYWEAKRKLDNMIQFRKLLQAKITSESMGPPTNPKLRPLAEVVDAAQPPKSPAGPNLFLGAGLLAIGLFPTVGGFLMLKFSRHPVRL